MMAVLKRIPHIGRSAVVAVFFYCISIRVPKMHSHRTSHEQYPGWKTELVTRTHVSGR